MFGAVAYEGRRRLTGRSSIRARLGPCIPPRGSRARSIPIPEVLTRVRLFTCASLRVIWREQTCHGGLSRACLRSQPQVASEATLLAKPARGSPQATRFGVCQSWCPFDRHRPEAPFIAESPAPATVIPRCRRFLPKLFATVPAAEGVAPS